MTREFGGLTIFSQIAKKLPNEDIIYLGDTKQFPYGGKSKETIIELTKKNIEFLIKEGVKAVVIACGTATSQALEEIEGKYSIPIIGIIKPTVLDMLKENRIGEIGIMATTGTIRSGAWEREINREIKNAKVINKACPLLAIMAEEGWTSNEIARLTIREYVKCFKKTNINKLILGCTHYPLFKDLINEELGDKIDIIDVGVNVAKYLRGLLEETGSSNVNTNKPKYNIYLTDMETEFLNVANRFINKDIEIKKAIID